MKYDLIIRNGTVIDGTGAARFAADVAVINGRIAFVGPLDSDHGEVEIDAGGQIVAPGFIDSHTHDDRLLLSAPDMTPKVSQGVTTVVAGNCGISLAPAPAGMDRPVAPPLDLLDESGSWFRFASFRDYVAELRTQPAATNCALLVGHSLLRLQTMDNVERTATGDEVKQMRALADEALGAGAIGISTGLFYEPARAASTEEVIEVCRPLAARNGVYATHMRDEGDRVVESLEETFRVGRELGVPVVISHHKVAGARNHGRSGETLPLIEERMRSQAIGLDCYPYPASSTILSASRAAAAQKTLVTWSKPHPEVAGMDLADIEIPLEQLLPAGAVYFTMHEADVRRILVFEHTMIGSDGLPHDAFPHPRLWGTFPRVLGHYSRELKLFSLETAVYKMTGLPAKMYGLLDRGVLKPGMAADVVIFDADEVADAATFTRPIQAARGIEGVIVNGRVVWQGGEATGARPGQVLTRG
jgi:N-acyl-D-amino-acid deacylase